MENETPKGKAIHLTDFIQYADKSVVSKTLLDKKTGTVTLFAFAAGEGLSEHTTPFDALVQVLDGQAKLVIGGEEVVASTGDLVIMPADVPHALRAEEPFKMLLTMIRS